MGARGELGRVCREGGKGEEGFFGTAPDYVEVLGEGSGDRVNLPGSFLVR